MQFGIATVHVSTWRPFFFSLYNVSAWPIVSQQCFVTFPLQIHVEYDKVMHQIHLRQGVGRLIDLTLILLML
jgi:hypothetical protein